MIGSCVDGLVIQVFKIGMLCTVKVLEQYGLCGVVVSAPG